jgi:hypothetical protein
MNPYANPYAPPQAGYDFGPGAQAPAEAGGVPDTVVEQLRATRPWVLFLAIMGFLGSGLLGLVGLIFLAAGSVGPGGGKLPAAFGLVYIVPAAIGVFPSVGLLRYGSAIGRLVRDPCVERLVVALGQQRAFWKLVGILTVVTIALYLLGIVTMIALFAVKGMR